MSSVRIAVLVALVACKRDEVEISDVAVAVDAARPGLAVVTFTSSAEGVGSVRYTADGVEGRTPVGPAATAHTVSVLGLKPDVPYTFTVEVDVDGELVAGDPVQQRTAAVAGPPTPTLILDDPASTCSDPYFLVTFNELFGTSWVVVVDRAGDIVWAAQSGPEDFVTRARPGLDGASILFNHSDATRVDDIGAVTRMSLDYATATETRTLDAHHDFLELGDGTMGWLSYDFRELELEGEVLPVAADVIREDLEGTSTEDTNREVFNVFDDYPPGVWLLESGDMDLGHFLPGFHEFSHGNSLMLSGDGTTWYVMFRWLDALIAVDRTSGEQLWQLGGEHSDFTAPEGHAFSHAHMSELWDGGMLMFDNADNTSHVSGVVEYAFDEAARTYEKVWEYRDPAGKFELLLGDAHRMNSCDNVVVSWATQRRLTEVTRDGRVVWELQTPPGWIMGRVTPLMDLYDLTQ